ncbi:small acid-soluble spore protein SspI [Salimicrobium halophilum]|uniref:Small, acid-soluble spore protein I n=1 Tax=Salimicrobium halophilum TaxID=86666 RepID=A0A1G8VGN8_9BACI|nr:small acid-soluble spore protein SspI [Salimicrobium halophilum]SDJ65074.1 small acid-soluble spore protein I (minor) [Salimicrobium halophilum]
MGLNLRQAILDNVENHNKNQLQATIEDALESREEKMLPGLGVLFEMLWQEADENDRTLMLETLEESLARK